MIFVPFRLPVSVLLVKAFDGIAQIAGELPVSVLVSNVIVSKAIYDIIIGSLLCYGVEQMSRDIKGRKAISFSSDDSVYWWTGLIITFSVIFTGFDIYSVVELMNAWHK